MIAGLAFTVTNLMFELADAFEIWNFEMEEDDESLLVLAYSINASAFFFVYVATVITFGIWIYWSARNLIEGGVSGFDYSAGWSVGWYFVPFANFVMPFLVMKQIWNGSHVDEDNMDEGNTILTCWWTAWLLFNILHRISGQIESKAESIEIMALASYFTVASSVAALALYPLALKLVNTITEAQLEYLQLRSLEQEFQ